MSGKPIIPRERTIRDIEVAVDRYLLEAGESVALGFVDHLDHAYRHIGQHPGSGFSRYAHELDIPGLRFWPMKRCPFLVLYVERESHIDVWRILHAERDIPARMRDDDAFTPPPVPDPDRR